MPTSWQEYQFLQRQLEEVVADPDAAAGVAEEAKGYVTRLQEDYDQFKAILAEGCARGRPCHLLVGSALPPSLARRVPATRRLRATPFGSALCGALLTLPP